MIVLEWQIGDVKVTRILDLETALPAGILLPASTPEAIADIAWLKPNFVDAAGNLRLSIHALVVQTPKKLVVVDTCVGDFKNREAPVFNQLQTGFLDSFMKAGFSPDAVDVVLCTHLHVDHVGWNTRWVDGAWQPTFPNARYLLGREELAFWQSQPQTGDVQNIYADSIQPLFDAKLVDLVEIDHRICDEISLMATPGHTPGHVSVKIVSAGKEALITGDIAHHPAQLARPEWSCFIDVDPELGCASRHQAFANIADRPILAIGTHFPAPTAGFVVTDGDGWRLCSEITHSK